MTEGQADQLAALRGRFGAAIERSVVFAGQQVVYVAAAQAHAVLEWLQQDPSQRFDYLTDPTECPVTCPDPANPNAPQCARCVKIVDRYGPVSCLKSSTEAHDGRIRPLFEE